MFCTKCACEILEGDAFCPRCGQAITPPEEDEVYQNNESDNNESYIGNHDYTMIYDADEDSVGKGSKAAKTVLVVLMALVLVVGLFAGVLMMQGIDPIDFVKAQINGMTTSSDEQLPPSGADLIDVFATTTQTSATDISDSMSTTVTTTTTTSSTTTTTRKTTTTTKTTTTRATTTTTTAAPVGDLIRETAVGKWSADISSLGIEVAGIKIKSITLDIDKNGNADVGYKVFGITSHTTGSFTVEDNGRTTLLINVPITGDAITVVGYSTVISNDEILFSCALGDVTLKRK